MKLLGSSFIINFFFINYFKFICKEHSILIFLFSKETSKRSYFIKKKHDRHYNVFFLNFKRRFTYKAPILNFNFKNEMHNLFYDVRIQKNKNYLKLKFIHFEKIWNYQFDYIYLKTYNKKFFEYLNSNSYYKNNYINFLVGILYRFSLFSFIFFKSSGIIHNFKKGLIAKGTLTSLGSINRNHKSSLQKIFHSINKTNDSKVLDGYSRRYYINFLYFLFANKRVEKVSTRRIIQAENIIRKLKNRFLNYFLIYTYSLQIFYKNMRFGRSLIIKSKNYPSYDQIFFFYNFGYKILNFTDRWVFSLNYLYKPGYFFFIADQSSFLNFIFAFLKRDKNSFLNTTVWLDRGFFFPIEVSLSKFYFSYYSNFFFNFFETSTFINLNTHLYKFGNYDVVDKKKDIDPVYKVFFKKMAPKHFKPLQSLNFLGHKVRDLFVNTAPKYIKRSKPYLFYFFSRILRRRGDSLIKRKRSIVKYKIDYIKKKRRRYRYRDRAYYEKKSLKKLSARRVKRFFTNKKLLFWRKRRRITKRAVLKKFIYFFNKKKKKDE